MITSLSTIHGPLGGSLSLKGAAPQLADIQGLCAVFFYFIFLFVSSTRLQVTTSTAPMQIMAQNACSGARKPLRGLNDS